MDGNRFDTMTRSLTASGSRRRALAAVGIFGLLGLTDRNDAAAARKSGKCQPTCGECEKCKKGNCDKKNGRKRCQKGKCRPKTVGTPCTAFPGGACQDGTCVNLQADEANCGSVGTVCGPNQVCQAGSCFPGSTCPASTTQYCPSGGPATKCGSDTPFDCFCSRSAEGNVVCVSDDGPPCLKATPCTTSATCPAGSACVEFGSCCTAGTPTHTCMPRCPTPDA